MWRGVESLRVNVGLIRPISLHLLFLIQLIYKENFTLQNFFFYI